MEWLTREACCSRSADKGFADAQGPPTTEARCNGKVLQKAVQSPGTPGNTGLPYYRNMQRKISGRTEMVHNISGRNSMTNARYNFACYSIAGMTPALSLLRHHISTQHEWSVSDDALI